jgi:hypothetical protein
VIKRAAKSTIESIRNDLILDQISWWIVILGIFPSFSTIPIDSKKGILILTFKDYSADPFGGVFAFDLG